MIEDADREQIDEMTFVLTDRIKPTLVFISVGSYRKRDELRTELGRVLPGNPSGILDISGHAITSLFRTIRERAPAEALNSRPGVYLLHVHGIEDSLLVSKDGKIVASSLLAQLNMERENLFREIPCCLILWTTTHFIDKLRTEAPDLWDWVTYYCDFPDEHRETVTEDAAQIKPKAVGVTDDRK